jgi:hypothetical protein
MRAVRRTHTDVRSANMSFAKKTRFLLVTFLDSGHPALRGFAASFAVRAAPAARCASKEK